MKAIGLPPLMIMMSCRACEYKKCSLNITHILGANLPQRQSHTPDQEPSLFLLGELPLFKNDDKSRLGKQDNGPTCSKTPKSS